MAKILSCPQCSQPFEVPAGHESAPQLQCPFCSKLVDNPSSGDADSEFVPRVPLGPYVPPPNLAQMAPPPAPPVIPSAPALAGEAVLSDKSPPSSPVSIQDIARTLSADAPGESIVVDGLPAETRRYGRDELAADDELTPEEDPHLVGYQQAQARRLGADPNSEGNAELIADVGDVPKGSRRGTYVLLFLFILLLIGDFAIIFAAIRNNGIFHFGRFSDMISVAKGEMDAMEIAVHEKKRISQEELKPIETAAAKPQLQVAFSIPVSLELNDGTSVIALYGQVTNSSPTPFHQLEFEAVIRTPRGELSVSMSFGPMPTELASQITNPQQLVTSVIAMPTVGDVEVWMKNNLRDAKDTVLPTSTPRPFVVVFTKTCPNEITDEMLFELRLLNAEPKS
ncbi:MAG: hypothetical protein RBU37_27695 [Myxococcota bacterium]|jgi:hypothetical protein|nr:hypothetical protein [Myxococcota bacterium]